MTKIMTVLGTRPEIVRLARIIPALDGAFDHVVLHTGQNAAPCLRDVFFDELGLRAPDIALNPPPGPPGARLGFLLAAVEEAILRERPDAMLILGDTDSALSCLVARRHGVVVYHMEAGNRCFDRESPEEANRCVVDHSADFNLAYTETARANLLREGLAPRRVVVTGSPLREVIEHHRASIAGSDVLRRLGLERGRYLLASLHRQETVDRPERLAGMIESLALLHRRTGLPVMLSTHPRTRDRLASAGIVAPPGVRLSEPFGFCDWCHLQRHAACVLSDSGTAPEEAALLGFRAVIARRSMERPEAIDHGGVVLCGIEPEAIADSVGIALGLDLPTHIPAGYNVMDVSRRVVALIAGTWRLSRHWS